MAPVLHLPLDRPASAAADFLEVLRSVPTLELASYWFSAGSIYLRISP